MVYTERVQEITNAYSFTNIEFPRQTKLIKRLRYVSFIINDIILFGSFVAITLWLINALGIKIDLLDMLTIPPFIPILFIFAGSSLLFGAKRHLLSKHYDADKEDHNWWSPWIPIALAGLTAVGGLINLLHLTDSGTLSFLHTSTYGGFCFFLIGLALIPPFTHILHRFHITQFFIYIVSGLNVFVVLESIYQLFSPLAAQHILQVPLLVAIVFVFFCFGILLRWSNRGFFGNFTLDSTVSLFALRLFLINLISGPLITFLVLLITQKSSYNLYQVITIVVSLFTSLASILLWVNVKLLYRYDLEHMLMRESLRAHNIDLTTEEETLRKRIAHIEQEKQQYLDKLSSEKVLQDVVDKTV